MFRLDCLNDRFLIAVIAILHVFINHSLAVQKGVQDSDRDQITDLEWDNLIYKKKEGCIYHYYHHRCHDRCRNLVFCYIWFMSVKITHLMITFILLCFSGLNYKILSILLSLYEFISKCLTNSSQKISFETSSLKPITDSLTILMKLPSANSYSIKPVW